MPTNFATTRTARAAKKKIKIIYKLSNLIDKKLELKFNRNFYPADSYQHYIKFFFGSLLAVSNAKEWRANLVKGSKQTEKQLMHKIIFYAQFFSVIIS